METEKSNNIEPFNRVVLLVLAKLYESFPVPISLDSEQVGHEAVKDSEAEHQPPKLIKSVASNSIAFLVEEGFLRYDPSFRTMSGPDFPAAKLTLKGFTLLGSMPSTVDGAIDRRPFSDQLRGAVNEGASNSVADLVKSLFTGAVNLGITAASSM